MKKIITFVKSKVMRTITFIFINLLCCILFSQNCTIFFSDGKTIDANLLEVNKEKDIVLTVVKGKVSSFDLSEIEKIVMDINSANANVMVGEQPKMRENNKYSNKQNNNNYNYNNFTKKKSVFLASFLSLCYPGIGQFYNNQPIKGVVFSTIGVVTITTSVLGIYDDNKVMWIGIGLLIANSLISSIDAGISAHRINVGKIASLRVAPNVFVPNYASNKTQFGTTLSLQSR